MTSPMNITCSAVIHMDSMIGKKWNYDGDNDVMVSSTN